MNRILLPLALTLSTFTVACGDERDDRPIEEAKRDVKAAGDKIADGAENVGQAIENGAENVVAEVDDLGLTTSVKTALVAAEDLKAADITVRSENGVVTLTGTVPTLGQKMRATSVASDVKGVARVKNELEIRN